MTDDNDVMKALYDARDGYLYVQLQGVFDQTASHGLAHEIVEQARRCERSQVLCDLTAVSGLGPDSASIWDHLEISEFAAHVIPKALRVAVLETPQQLIGGRVGEDLMIQRGVQVRVTSSADEALAWLGVVDSNFLVTAQRPTLPSTEA